MIQKTCWLVIASLLFNSAIASVPEKAHIAFCTKITAQIVDGNYSEEDILNVAKSKFSGKSLDISGDKVSEVMKKVKVASSGTGMAEMKSICVNQFRNDFTSTAGDVIGFFAGTKEDKIAPPSAEVDNASDALMNGNGGELIELDIHKESMPKISELCQGNEKKEEECGAPPIFLTESVEDLEKVVVFQGPQDQPFSEADCLCYMKKKNSNKANVISKASDESDQINHAIIRASGKKFLNDFAQFYEDIRFYESSNPLVLKSDAKTAIDSKVLCNDPKAFKKKIDDKCSANGTADGKDNRISEILGAYGDDFSRSTNDFAASFAGMVQDIENVSVIPESSNGSKDKKGAMVNRETFEGVRFGFSESLGEVSAVDEMTAIIVKDKDFKSQLDLYIANNGNPISPLAAIEKLLSQNGNSSTIRKILRRVDGKKNTVVVRRLKKALDSGNFDKVRSEIFKKGLTYHPGLKNLLLDPILFNKASQNVGFKQESILRSVEKNKDFISHFNQRCDSLQNKLADAVCVKSSELKSKVNKQEMIKILTKDKVLNSSKGQNSEAINLTLCAMTYNQVAPDSAFGGLLPSEQFSISDYQDRKENESPKDQNNLFSNFAKTKAQNTTLSEQLNNIAASVSYGRVSSGQMNSSSDSDDLAQFPTSPGPHNFDVQAGRDSLSNGKLAGAVNSNMTSAVQKGESYAQSQSDDISEQIPKTIPVNNVTQASPQYVNNFTTPMAKTAEVKELPSNEEQVSPIREELKNSIKGKDQKKIDGFINNISDADAQELSRYRAQSKKEREAITDSRLEQERLKTLELKAQYEELEKKLELLKKEKPSIADNNSSSGSSNSGGYQETNQEQDEGFSNFGSKTNTTNFQAAGGSTSGNPSAIGGNTQASGQFRDPSSNSNAANGRDLGGKVGDGMSLVIKSQAGNGQATAEDPSSELITYLTKNETDSKTLRDLKESGLIYTYEVNENGATVEKKKMIKYTELSAEAKALVDKKISILVEKESSDLERQISSLKRTYSIQALKLEILTSNQSGSLN
jgi:hypothetical protein